MIADDQATGLPIFSLYGRRPENPRRLNSLANVDARWFTMFRISAARFYTYISTMGLVLEAAARRQASR